MAVLEKLEFMELPASRIIGVEIISGGGYNSVPALWEQIIGQNKLDVLDSKQALLDMHIGWMSEFIIFRVHSHI